MEKGKYVMFNTNHLVMFDGTFEHKDFQRLEYEGFKITSAGFFTVDPSKDESFGISVCTNYGDSWTLKIGPQPLDKQYIKATILGVSISEL